MTTLLVVQIAAVTLAVPGTAVLLRRARRRATRLLRQRLGSGTISAGVPANWLSASHRTQWSGCLAIVGNSLRWEPDKASVKKGARAQEWSLVGIHAEVTRTGRGFTGERYGAIRLTPTSGPTTNFITFRGVGPWHELLGLTEG